MVRLNDEIKAMFEKQLGLIATASKDGVPNIGARGSMRVLDDETLVFNEGAGEKTFRNLQLNPKVAVIVIDREKSDGYQIKGTAEVLTSGALFDEAVRTAPLRKRRPPKAVVRIKINEIYSVRPGNTAGRLA
jgi:predicted pyridoxine 5'-phosphate oxidase superfamily flavin-nucleotide-binding protein